MLKGYEKTTQRKSIIQYKWSKHLFPKLIARDVQKQQQKMRRQHQSKQL